MTQQPDDFRQAKPHIPFVPMKYYGTLDGFPAIWTERRGWMQILNGDWTEASIAELMTNAAMMDQARFERAFRDLPPYPKEFLTSPGIAKPPFTFPNTGPWR